MKQCKLANLATTGKHAGCAGDRRGEGRGEACQALGAPERGPTGRPIPSGTFPAGQVTHVGRVSDPSGRLGEPSYTVTLTWGEA
jgi:hypothetical protein